MSFTIYHHEPASSYVLRSVAGRECTSVPVWTEDEGTGINSAKRPSDLSIDPHGQASLGLHDHSSVPAVRSRHYMFAAPLRHDSHAHRVELQTSVAARVPEVRRRSPHAEPGVCTGGRRRSGLRAPRVATPPDGGEHETPSDAGPKGPAATSRDRAQTPHGTTLAIHMSTNPERPSSPRPRRTVIDRRVLESGPFVLLAARQRNQVNLRLDPPRCFS